MTTMIIPDDPIGGVITGAEGTFTSGQTVTLQAISNLGYEFDSWIIGSDNITDNPCSFTIMEDVFVIALFNEVQTRYNVSIVNGTPGSEQYVTISGAGQKVQGEVFTLSATYSYPYNGCHWYLNGQEVSGGDSYLYTNNGDGIQSDLEFTVYFDYIPQNRTITVASNNPSCGTVQIAFLGEQSNTSLIVYEGQPITLTATPNSGYQFDGWYYNNEKVSSNAVYTFTLPEWSTDRTYTANFINAQE